MNAERCSFPTGASGDPCRKIAVAAYIVGGERYLRCKAHDGPKVRATAEEKGAARLPLDRVAA